ncbi:hypothetical protein BJF71_03065 [Helicobacter pylori]|nr:hypothetical protein BJF71_03065 [Helicobacter pylori]
MENDVKEDLEQARPKLELEKQTQELEKQTQEKEQEIKKKEGIKYIYIFSEIIKEERKYICIIIFFIHALSYFK